MLGVSRTRSGDRAATYWTDRAVGAREPRLLEALNELAGRRETEAACVCVTDSEDSLHGTLGGTPVSTGPDTGLRSSLRQN